MKMTLVHDMGEALIGDITPSDNILRGLIQTRIKFSQLTNNIEEKRRRERLAVQYLACLAEPVNPIFAKEIEDLWSEYEEGVSDVARLVKGTDALECMDQAVIYEKRLRRESTLSEFMQLEQKVEAPELKGWMAHLKQERETLWRQERADTMLIFVLGSVDAVSYFTPSLLFSRWPWCWQRHAMFQACSRLWLHTYLCGRSSARRSTVACV